MNNLLSLEEVRTYLEVEDRKLDDYIKGGKLRAYKIGGTYLRFRKEEVLNLKQELNSGRKTGFGIPWFARARDFWRFNNFYIISFIVIAILFFIVLRS